MAALTLLSILANGQNDPLFSHYMFNPSYYNPGWLGDVQSSFAVVQYRSQWVGYSTTLDGDGGAPTSQLMSFAIPVNGFLKTAGLNIVNDQVGAETIMKAQVAIAYATHFEKGTLSFGLAPGLVSRTLDGSRFRPENPGDPVIPTGRETQAKPDAQVGVFYSTFSGFFGGVSMDHILSPSLIRIDATNAQSQGKLLPVYYFHGGKKMSLNRDTELTPTFLLRSTAGGYSMDVSGVLNYRSTMWTGLSYRSAESIVLLIGYSFLENKELKVGYSFDYVVQNQEAKRPTSHEIFIRYDLPSLILGGRKAVKTPRFSF